MNYNTKEIFPSEIRGWVKYERCLVDHGNKRPIKYTVVSNNYTQNNKAVFFLHGLGGNKDESNNYNKLFCEKLGYKFIRVEQPLLIIQDILQGASLLVGVKARTILATIRNINHLISEIATKENIHEYGIFGISFGGFSAIVNGFKDNRARKIFMYSSTPDIAYAIQHLEYLFNDFIQRKFAKIATFNIRTEFKNLRIGKGLWRGLWNTFHPWQKPDNTNVDIYILTNKHDPLMQGISQYRDFMKNNYGFNRISFDLLDGAQNTHDLPLNEEFLFEKLKHHIQL